MSTRNKKSNKPLSNQLKGILQKRSPSSSEDELSILELSKHQKALKKLKTNVGLSTSALKKRKVHSESSLLALKRTNLEKASTSMKREYRVVEEESENDGQDEELEHHDREIDEPSQEHETLFGKHFTGDQMVDIGNHVYCKQKILDMALSTSHRSSHIARKLLDGIVKKEYLLKSTLTGRPARAQGTDRQQVEVIPINYKARKAIVEYSLQHAKENAFKILQDVETVERSMSQRIGEIKRLHELEELRQSRNK